MLDVGPVDLRAGEGQVRFDRLARVLGVADDQSAHHVHTVPVEDVDRALRRVAGRLPVFALLVLRGGPEELQVALEHVLDAEEHVAEPGRLHERGQPVPVVGDRRGHALNEVVDVLQAAIDDAAADRLEATHVDRDVVVHDEDRARPPGARVPDVVEHAVDGPGVEVAAAHLDDRAEAAVVGAPA